MPAIHKVYRLDAARMAKTCRKLAEDLRREHRAGWPPVPMSAISGGRVNTISRAEAAIRMDEQAARWEEEVRTGVPNYHDREKIGE